MNKAQLKEFAIYSRNKLRQDVYSRLKMFDISESGINNPTHETNDLVTFSNGFRLEGEDVKKYRNLGNHLNKISKDKVFKIALDDFVEEVAYTWFNRIIAIRFMEVNNYMPHGYRVLSSSEESVLEPEILKNYTYLDFYLTDNELNTLDELSLKADVHSQNKMFEILFLKQCHALNSALPELFEKTEDFKDLLLILSFTDQQSVVYKIVNEVSEASFDINAEDGSGQIEIIGWLYQYYNSDRKDEVINVIKKKSIRKEDIPAATQIFTPQWIVKYMVDNSLGKYWIERNPNSSLKDELEYLIKDNIETINESISPEDLTFLDNAMGSGHILVYAFDVLMKIYISEGYQPRKAANLILEKNLYGLDIDKRAYQLAYFALMMKAREHNTRILEQNINLNIEYFEDVNINPSDLDQFGISFSPKEKEQCKNDLLELTNLFKHATELGSIIIPPQMDYSKLQTFITDKPNEISLIEKNLINIENQLTKTIDILDILNNKYHVVATNPPYMGKFDEILTNYIKNNYFDFKEDLYSVFIYKNMQLLVSNGYSSFMTPLVWMFIKKYNKLRTYLVNETNISSLIQLEYSAFEEATVPICTFVLSNKENNYGNYYRLVDFLGGMKVQERKYLELNSNSKSKNKYYTNQNNFNLIPGNPIAYWATERIIEVFEKEIPIEKILSPKQGLITADNNRFLRQWHEVKLGKISFSTINLDETLSNNKKWYPYNKGGMRRQWYGNYDYVVNWENNGTEIRNFKDSNGKLKSRPQNDNFYFQESITWNLITSGEFSIRYREKGSIHDAAGMSAFSSDLFNIKYTLGILGTKIADYIFKMLNPTLNLPVGDFKKFPVIDPKSIEKNLLDKIIKYVDENIEISKNDWNYNETSWNFRTTKLTIPNSMKLKDNYLMLKNTLEDIFKKLKSNEEKLNEIFIELYGLKEELEPTISDKDITITKIFDSKEDIYDEIKGNQYIKTKEDIIKEFMSYAVGCMMGRYSLDEEGLVYAGGDWDYSRYDKFKPQKDNVLIISDEAGVENDIVDRFVEFVRVSFGDENLEENLSFVADSLYSNGTVRERIRRYFNNDFYSHHVQMYKKTPTYWLYDSGSGKAKSKQENAFKALVYVHRYDGNTTGNVRINHLHEIQARFERERAMLENENASGELDAKTRRENENRISVLDRKLKEIKDYDENIAHIAIENIEIDLDDGIKVNHEKAQTDRNGKLYNILAKIK